MKYSRQRELILESVRNCTDHPTADTIYARVRIQDPKVSLGTVYRNLNLLAENGQLRKISIPGGSDRFDRTMMEHGHIICTQCGAVSDIVPEHLRALDDEISRSTDYKVTRRELILEGICPECQKNHLC